MTDLTYKFICIQWHLQSHSAAVENGNQAPNAFCLNCALTGPVYLATSAFSSWEPQEDVEKFGEDLITWKDVCQVHSMDCALDWQALTFMRLA